MSDDLGNMPGVELIDRAVTSGDQAILDAAMARINEKANAVKKALDAGVSPTDFKRLESVRSALDSAGKVVAKTFEAAKQARGA
ncbi:MAG: hypothetical protein AAGC81_07495 [Pseudomonadota bacterium]